MLTVLCLLFLTEPARSSDTYDIPVLASVGPWTYATKPVAYRGRIWFANANRWPDHNSADIWSVTPDGSTLRRERRLFSQDVGEPIVHKGLLYWPFEDPRVSLGWGQIAVTNGTDWRILETRVGRQFHLHGLFPGNPDHSGLLAGASSWNAQILHSSDRGRNWDVLWEKEREENRFSRTYHVTTTVIGLVADLMVFGAPLRSFGAVGRLGSLPIQPISGWPDDMLVRRMTPYRGGVLALLNRQQTGESRLIFDSPLLIGDMALESQLRDISLPEGITPIDFDSSGATVALLGKDEARVHTIWLTTGEHWQPLGRITAHSPLEIRLAGKMAVIAGTSGDQGIIWAVDTAQEDSARDVASSGKVPDLPQQIEPVPLDIEEARQQIANALADKRNYRGHGLGLRRVIDKWVMRGLPGDVLAASLDGPFPDGEVKLIGGRAFASHRRFGRWVLTWGMRRAGSGRIPVAWLDLPFDEPENGSRKYFGEKLAAIRTVAATGQDDRATMSGLRRITEDVSLPEWLRQDASWAIHALRTE